eukprot:gene16190-8859_t
MAEELTALTPCGELLNLLGLEQYAPIFSKEGFDFVGDLRKAAFADAVMSLCITK